jgi:transcriptional regulator with XRE-family HTH domain
MELGSDSDVETKDLIRALRVALKLTQAEVAERAGFPQHTYVSRVEKGENNLSTTRARGAYARAFGLSPADFDAYLDGRVGLDAVLSLARRYAVPTPPELHIERDPVPAIHPHPDASPLERAVSQAFDPTKHLITDATAVIGVLRDGIDAHLRSEHDLVEKARAWLDAASALRREGVRVNAATLIDRLTLGKGARLQPDEEDAFQREIAEVAAKHGVTFGQAVHSLEEFLQRGREANELAKRGGRK